MSYPLLQQFSSFLNFINCLSSFHHCLIQLYVLNNDNYFTWYLLTSTFETETLNLSDCLMISLLELEQNFSRDVIDNGFLNWRTMWQCNPFCSPIRCITLIMKITAIDFILPYSLPDTQITCLTFSFPIVIRYIYWYFYHWPSIIQQLMCVS